MKALDFIKINPAGNVTILIENIDITKEDLVDISKKIMQETNLHAEQVGFIDNNHLQMMGGEFCGNASRAFASLLAYRDKNFSKEQLYMITCSGEEELLEINVKQDKEKNKFTSKVKMPKCIEVKEIEISGYKLGLVEFSGIHHFIFDIKLYSDVDYEKIINLVKNYLSKIDYSAFGLMFFDSETYTIKPYVYVKELENGIYENSCASGTTALAYYLKKYKNIQEARIIQPNGWLEFSFEAEKVYIDGPVEIVAMGKVFIE